MEQPEKTVAYRSGVFNRRIGKGKDANPYPRKKRVEQHLWLAGWHDMDMVLLKSEKTP